MSTTTICISSLEDLEAAIRDIGPGLPVSAVFVGATDLFQAAAIYRRLQIQVEATKGLWEIDRESLVGLRGAAEHYGHLDLLEISLDLMELDLNEAVPMKPVRFTGVRDTANDVVTTAHPSTALKILDGITIESQLIGRVARALGFGAPDVEVPNLTEDDLAWLTADGDAVYCQPGHGGDPELGLGKVDLVDGDVRSGFGLGNSDKGGNHGDAGDSQHTHGVGAELGLRSSDKDGGNHCGKVDLVDGDVRSGFGLNSDKGGNHGDAGDSKHTHGVGAELGLRSSDNDGGNHGGHKFDLDSSDEGDWIEMKGEKVLAILKFKLEKVRCAIKAAKDRAFIGP